ncbi:hypothetical protein DFH06DRAFT_448035, partial [Mycena polygramma]
NTSPSSHHHLAFRAPPRHSSRSAQLIYRWYHRGWTCSTPPDGLTPSLRDAPGPLLVDRLFGIHGPRRLSPASRPRLLPRTVRAGHAAHQRCLMTWQSPDARPSSGAHALLLLAVLAPQLRHITQQRLPSSLGHYVLPARRAPTDLHLTSARRDAGERPLICYRLLPIERIPHVLVFGIASILTRLSAALDPRLHTSLTSANRPTLKPAALRASSPAIPSHAATSLVNASS